VLLHAEDGDFSDDDYFDSDYESTITLVCIAVIPYQQLFVQHVAVIAKR